MPTQTRFEMLVSAVQELSRVETVGDVQCIVRTAARSVAGADGAAFVLRDDGRCYYADEDAIAPLWKGKRFPMESCISGWAMLNRSAAVIPDIYVDDRIPHDAYRPTFVKSLVMVPVRQVDPIGAIGVYWAAPHVATDAEVATLQALADSTAVALEIVARRESEAQAHALSRIDPLTGLANRRGWNEAAARAVESLQDVTIAVLDIDGLKAVNDAGGHEAGDRMLRACAGAWQECLRPGDVLARIGGDEFAVLLPGCSLDAAKAVADRLATAGPATCSVGLAAWGGGEPPSAVLARADEALYVAKRAGRARAFAAP